MGATHRLTIAAIGLAIFSLSAFVARAQLSYETHNGTITITGGCPSSAGAVTIPATINSLPVTRIGDYAFYDCAGLTSIVIPDSVTGIGDLAFAGCSNLTSITIPNSVTTLGNQAFVGCVGFTSITIPNGVTSIGLRAFAGCTSLTRVVLGNSVTRIRSGAFAGCKSLTSIVIPSSVTSIGNNVFGACTSLTSIVVDSANPNYSSLDGVLFNKSQTTPLRCPEGKAGSYSIPNSVTRIPGAGFGYFGAFAYCRSLTSVMIPNSVTNIGNSAFGYCTSLRAAYFHGEAQSVVGGDGTPFNGADNVTVYYLPGTTGWGSTFGGRPTAMWIPLVLDLPSLPPTRQLILHTTSPAPSQVRVQRSTNLIQWEDWQTVMKAAGPSALQDADAGTTPYRFYRGVQE